MSWSTFREELNDVLNEQELRTLCFDLAIDYESLPGNSKDVKIRELIALFQRNGRLPELISRLEAVRPKTNWQEMLPEPSLTEPEKSISSHQQRNLIVTVIILLGIILIFGLLYWNRENNNSDFVQGEVLNREVTTNDPTTNNEIIKPENAPCLDDYLAEIDAERISAIEVGERSRDIDVVTEDRVSAEFSAPYGIQLTKYGEQIGALIFIFRSQEVLFKIISVADKDCQEVTGYRNVTRRAEDTLQDNDVLEMPLNGGVYTIRPNFQGTQIRYSFQEVLSGEE